MKRTGEGLDRIPTDTKQQLTVLLAIRGKNHAQLLQHGDEVRIVQYSIKIKQLEILTVKVLFQLLHATKIEDGERAIGQH